MGRYVQPVLRSLERRNDIALTLLIRDSDDDGFYRTIVGEAVQLASPSSARTKHRYDRIWYPWNAMRFRARAPALVTINDDFAFSFPASGFVARWREQRPILRAIHAAARIVTISAWSRDTLIKRFALNPQKISVIPLAPDPYFTSGPETSEFSEPFVLAVGSGEGRKNVDFLVDAFLRAFPERDVRLVVVGTLQAAVSARLSRASMPVTTLSHVDDERLRRLYRTAAAVAVPSLAEGFGLVVAEAQACGAAVLAANASALPEALGDAGLAVDPRDVDAWRVALETVIRDPAVNARYRALATKRWTNVSLDATTEAIVVALERTIDDGI